jgi:hypothetical protein
MNAHDRHDLDAVREDLKRLGYLDPGLERFFLTDTLAGRPPLRALLSLALRDTLLAAPILALLLALSLAMANGNLSHTPLDVLPLSLHCLPLAALFGFGGFLVLGLLMVPLVRLWPRGAESWSLALTALALGTALGAAGWASRDVLVEAARGARALEAVAGAGLVYALGKVVATGLFAWSIQLSERAPIRRWLGRRVWAGLAVVAAVLALLPLVFVADPPPLESAPALPTAPGESVALIGVDGIRADEFRYFLDSGALPRFAAALAEGARVAPYRRGVEAPSSLWTAVATGRPTPDHGVVSLDSFRPLGVRTPLARNGPLRAYWQRFGEPLGWVEHRATLSDRRQAFTFWELAARAGEPIVAVNWWATFPAEELPGLVVAHGAYSLFDAADESGKSAAGAPIVAPANRRAEVEALRDPAAASDFARSLRAALSRERADAILERSFLPDSFAWRTVEAALTPQTRALALYLPGVDIAANDLEREATAGPVLVDVARRQLEDLDRRLDDLRARFGTVAVVVDPGRRSGAPPLEGLVVWLRRTPCSGSADAAPDDLTRIAPSLMRALGLPQSAELAEPTALCGWPEPPARLPSLGRRGVAADAEGAEEYLRSLRALGYL